MVSCFGLIGDYSNKFHCAVGLDQYTYYDLIYQKNPTIEEIMDTNYSLDIIAYNLSFLTWEEIEKLMEKSLKEDKDLLFEACKDKKVVITHKMQMEALEKRQILDLQHIFLKISHKFK